jgi:hypothetical protein
LIHIHEIGQVFFIFLNQPFIFILRSLHFSNSNIGITCDYTFRSL